MIAVMVDAKVPGSSSWVAVRHAKKIRVSGMSSGLLNIFLQEDDGAVFTVFGGGKDEVFNIPDTVERVKAVLEKLADGDRVFVDLE